MKAPAIIALAYLVVFELGCILAGAWRRDYEMLALGACPLVAGVAGYAWGAWTGRRREADGGGQ